MNTITTIMPPLFVATAVLALAFALGPVSKLSPKPEIEMTVAETNVNATVITWTRTEDGHKLTWGFVEVNGKTLALIPRIE
jgi:hypothetical protein